MATKASTNQILIQKIEILEGGSNEVKIKLSKLNPFYKSAYGYMKVSRLHSQTLLNKTKLKKFFSTLHKENGDISKTIESIGLNMEQFERPEITDNLDVVLNHEGINWEDFPRKEGESDEDYYREFIREEVDASSIEIYRYLNTESGPNYENYYDMIESGYIYNGQKLKEKDVLKAKYRGYYNDYGNSFFGNFLEVLDFEPIDNYFRFIVDGKELAEQEFLKLKE